MSKSPSRRSWNSPYRFLQSWPQSNLTVSPPQIYEAPRIVRGYDHYPIRNQLQDGFTHGYSKTISHEILTRKDAKVNLL